MAGTVAPGSRLINIRAIKVLPRRLALNVAAAAKTIPSRDSGKTVRQPQFTQWETRFCSRGDGSCRRFNEVKTPVAGVQPSEMSPGADTPEGKGPRSFASDDAKRSKFTEMIYLMTLCDPE